MNPDPRFHRRFNLGGAVVQLQVFPSSAPEFKIRVSVSGAMHLGPGDHLILLRHLEELGESVTQLASLQEHLHPEARQIYNKVLTPSQRLEYLKPMLRGG